LIEAADNASHQIGVTTSCKALGVSRATLYRARKPKTEPKPPEKPFSPRALGERERRQVLEVLHEERFMDQAPAAIYATLLDEGRYLCSIRTMYRILEEANEIRERRRQTRHPNYAKPVLIATQPKQVWTWDITKLLGPAKWTYYYLYVILDIFSRYVVGWMVAHRESATLAKRLIEETCMKQKISKDHLTLHSDRGSSMTSKPVALMLSDLGITKSHSRPRVSNDNPFSESQFKTLKYQPDFPQRFGSLEDARMFCRQFFEWYNTEHKHSGIGLLTPETLHLGNAESVLAGRQEVLDQAYEQFPERFVQKPPQVKRFQEEVWINPPESILEI
jgi:putative transposase